MKSISLGLATGSLALLASPAVAVYHGTAGENDYVGTTSADRALMGDGNDVAYGRAGGDTLFGGQGSDLLDGGAGADRLHGGSGNDQLEGQRGVDSIDGGPGMDVALPGDGRDRVRLGVGDDEVVLEPDGAVDVISCGSGYDTVVLFPRADPRDVLKDCEETYVLVVTPRAR